MESTSRKMEAAPVRLAAVGRPVLSNSPPKAPSRAGVAISLFALYVIWGSTYLAMRVAMQSFPPFRMGALRFLIAGATLLLFARSRGAALPTPVQWRNAAVIGTLLLAFGNGGVAYAEQTVGSGLAALVISAMPLWMAGFSGLFGKWPSAGDWGALALGALGIVLLNHGSDLRGSPAGMVALLLASGSWAFGSLWSRRLDLPQGSMAAAAEMLAGGAVLYILSLARGEQLSAPPSWRSIAALAYLIVFGSLLAYSAYLYLLARVRPTVASSYAYVNPVIAMLLGAALGGESIQPMALLAMPLILASVAVVLRPRRSLPEAVEAEAGPVRAGGGTVVARR
ncbi:MAG TPA: drug/metabolite exporter YedA [Myxococcaceae bacterium]|nr:drug/metabolite exporter YedA [Myxococcaceae bacterium]